MGIADAKRFVGKICAVKWQDRLGQEFSIVSKIHDVTYVPLYGGYVITDTEDIRLDKLTEMYVCEEMVEAQIAA